MVQEVGPKPFGARYESSAGSHGLAEGGGENVWANSEVRAESSPGGSKAAEGVGLVDD